VKSKRRATSCGLARPPRVLHPSPYGSLLPSSTDQHRESCCYSILLLTPSGGSLPSFGLLSPITAPFHLVKTYDGFVSRVLVAQRVSKSAALSFTVLLLTACYPCTLTFSFLSTHKYSRDTKPETRLRATFAATIAKLHEYLTSASIGI